MEVTVTSIDMDNSKDNARQVSTRSNNQKQVRFASSRRRWIKHNVLTRFYHQGSLSISQIFPANMAPNDVKWSLINAKLKTKKKNPWTSNSPEIKLHDSNSNSDPIALVDHEPPIKPQLQSEQSCSPIPENNFRKVPLKETIRGISLLSHDETISETPILLSYPIIAKISDFLDDSSDSTSEKDLTNLLKNGASCYLATCKRIINDDILRTNNYLSQFVDLNEAVLISKQETFLKVSTIPIWTHVRILEDEIGRRFIAVKNGHPLIWLISSLPNPLPDQRWLCFPIECMNTFANELSQTDENSLHWLILRMIMFKCIHRFHRNDMLSNKIDIDNILLVSSSCGLIIVFKECQRDFDIESFDILKTETVIDIPLNCRQAQIDVYEIAINFFRNLNIFPLLIAALWPVDILAYLLAQLILEFYDR